MPNTTAVRTAQVGAAPLFAGKNKIINGDFAINQRNFTSNTTNNTYGFDRWNQLNAGGTVTVTPQTFTAGAAPVAGYEGTNFVRIVSASQATQTNYAAITQRIESVRTLAGQTATISFWAKASTGTPKIGITLEQAFGATGSATVTTTIAAQTITSSWARYSFTVAVPSVSGKTISGGSDQLGIVIFTSCGTSVTGYSTDVGLQNVTVDFWGVQVEAGSTATAFQTATGTIQGELAACQRYFQTGFTSTGAFTSSSNLTSIGVLPVEMRAEPTLGTPSGQVYDLTGNQGLTVSGINFNGLSVNGGRVDFACSGATSGRIGGTLEKQNVLTLAISAEL